ncbi:hypothetical protein GY12_07800 [Micrococcus luteus]|nr:hypothetical protein GY12_07800 [Micrococcus luteus]
MPGRLHVGERGQVGAPAGEAIVVGVEQAVVGGEVHHHLVQRGGREPRADLGRGRLREAHGGDQSADAHGEGGHEQHRA